MNKFPITRRLIIATIAMLAVSMGSLIIMVHAEAAPPQLVISQFKITSSNGQFFTLYNTTDKPLDMSKFQLEYFNNYDISKSTSSRFIALSGTLPAHSYYMVNDATMQLCYQLTVDSVSLGLSSTSGMIEVLSFTQISPGGSVMPALQDYVSWSKTAASGAQTLPANSSAFLIRQPVDTGNNPTLMSPGAGSWQAVQPDTGATCKLTTVTATGTSGTAVSSGLNQLLPAVEPPATIISLPSPETVAAGLPASDIGLMTPIITEILPNPSGTGTDAADEFVEVYNPNTSVFDLTGFSLRSGMTTLHQVKFNDGLQVQPKSFTAFYAKDMYLSLSNSEGQVALLDPYGVVTSQTEPYQSAKEGQSWALGSGSWQWSTTVTPNASNIIVLPAVLLKKTASTVTHSVKPAKSTGSVKAARTKKPTTKAPKKVVLKSSNSFATAPPKTPIHPAVLATIAGGALLYGAYEYRTDLGNRIHQLRKYVAARRAHRV